MDAMVALGQWIWAPLVAFAISCVYFRKAGALPAQRRLLASGHGVLLSLLYIAALLTGVLGLSKPSLALPFWSAFAFPLTSAGLGLAWIKGKGALHMLLLMLLACAAWTFFIGTMAVTGEWL